jgi:alpha-1,6-mannosyltransferase
MILSYIWLCPFTKVEESFNMQAIHDLLHLSGSLDHTHGTNATSVLDLSDFDHLEFPGVVPRTFLGPIFLAAVSYPFQAILRTLFNKKIYSQYLIRVVMGLCSWLSFMAFRDSVSHRFGLRAGILTCTLASFQFHLPFYMSRTLPNTFALIGCLAAYSLWLRDRGLKALLVIAFFMITFRCDLLILLAPMTLQMLVCREVPFWTTALLGVGSAVIALLLTLSVDSFFWQRYVTLFTSCLPVSLFVSTSVSLSVCLSPSIFACSSSEHMYTYADTLCGR